ncbi:MAG TPA: winged helix-turn-helix domain-containing protein [Propionibacteriaceae bacterium]|nr:winged helix-turn-helix domain-containing protein [Propionibacteriaceae bacterium]
MEERRAEVRDDGTVVLRHPLSLRAIAHPARTHALEELYRGDPLTATELAEGAGVTPSAMSYHLRELEKWGLVVREPAEGDGRERPWRAAGRDITITGEAVGAQQLSPLRALTSRELQRLAERLDTLGPLVEGRAHETGGSIMRHELWLTNDEALSLVEEVRDLLARYAGNRTPRHHPEDAGRLDWWGFLLPDAGVTPPRRQPPPGSSAST